MKKKPNAKVEKGKGEKRLCRSNDSENEEFQSRERARLLNSPAAKTYMWSSPTHFCSTFRGFRGERKRRELSNRRKKEGFKVWNWEKIEISHLF